MSSLTSSTLLLINSNSTTLAIPKLCDDGSNWSDYEPRIQRAMGLKRLWRHVEGTTIVPQPYTLVARVPVLSDSKTPATEEQVEAKETKIMDYDKCEYLAQHIILSTTSTCLGAKIKNLKSTHEMWDVVTADATTKSMLYLLDAEDQLASMKLADNNDLKSHLAEVKQHFQLMMEHHNNLIKMGSTISDTCYNTIVMSSLPESYHLTLQTITAAECASVVLGTSSLKKMKADDLIAFIIEEAQHCIINDEQTKMAKSALTALSKKPKAGKQHSCRGKEKSVPDAAKCENCKGSGHDKANCWAKGGGKEGQGPRSQRGKMEEKRPEMAAIADTRHDADDLFVFTCTSDYANVANVLNVPKS